MSNRESNFFLWSLSLLNVNSIYLPPANEVWGKVICLQACVCPQGGSTWPGAPPGADTPPRPGTPPGSRHPPGSRPPPGDQVHPLGQVHPPWEQTPPPCPPGTRYTPRRRAYWEIRSTRGRYASYWNAIFWILYPEVMSFLRQYKRTLTRRMLQCSLRLLVCRFWFCFAGEFCEWCIHCTLESVLQII